FLLNELSRNVDGYRLSSYLYKDKNSNGGKLHAGPPWDYDIAWGNANYCDATEPSGWAYQFGDICPEHSAQIPFWWPRLMEDSAFADAVRCRWNELRDSVLSPAYVAAYCDSVAAQIDEAQQRNFTVWPILGTYVWPNPFPIPATYADEVQELKDFMNARWAWMDANLPGACLSTGIDQPSIATLEAPFPNPFANEVMFRTTTNEEVRIRIVDPLGRTILNAGPISGRGILHRIEIPSDLASGTYMLIGTTSSGGYSAYRLQH
ncbi:MAG: CotH kinase family protein, partial [Flavobacteriales bacterium]